MIFINNKHDFVVLPQFCQHHTLGHLPDATRSQEFIFIIYIYLLKWLYSCTVLPYWILYISIESYDMLYLITSFTTGKSFYNQNSSQDFGGIFPQENASIKNFPLFTRIWGGPKGGKLAPRYPWEWTPRAVYSGTGCSGMETSYWF